MIEKVSGLWEALLFAAMGAALGIGALMASNQPISARLLVGRAISTAGVSLWRTERDTGRQFHLLQFWFPWSETRGVLGRFGWKIKVDHNGTSPDESVQDRIKGSVYRMLPWKSK